MKLNQLTFTRFLAASTIVVYHYGLKIFPFDGGLLNGFFSTGNILVTYFFILSGFVMIVAYGQKKADKIDPPTYYANRFARIYPVYALALLFTIGLHPPHTNLPNAFLQFTLLQSWVPKHALSLNAPGWSLSTEAFFYLLFPWLFNALYKKLKFNVIAVLITAFYITTQVILYTLLHSGFYKGFATVSHDVIFYLPLSNLAMFLAGNLLGLCFLKIPHRYFRNHDLLSLVAFALICYIVATKVAAAYLAPLAFLLFILVLSLNKTGIITKAFSTRFLVLLGEISYGIYILQYPVYYALNNINAKAHLLNDTQVFYSGYAILVMIALASYYIIEKPVKTYIRNWHGTRKQRRTLITIKSEDTSPL